MPTPAIDFELYSEAGYVWDEPTEKHPLGRWVGPPGADKPGIAAVNSAAYLEHPSTEVLTCSYDLCDGKDVRRWRPGQRGARVVHCKREAYDVYCGRRSLWGNPFEIGKDGTREDVIAKHREWVLADWSRIQLARQLIGKTIACWCAPKACHCDTWAELAGLPWDLFDYVFSPGAELEAHNAMFERLAVELVCTRLYGWPVFPAHVWRCSMASAHVAQYPGALADLASVLDGEQQKDPEGKRLILKFCVPQQPIPGLVDKKTGRVKRPDVPARRIYPHDDPEDFERLCAYCDQDVRTEQDAMERVPPMAPGEVRAWQRNQEMNRRGLGVDRPGLRACIDILGQVLERYGEECRQLTGWSITQLEKLKGWLSAYGVIAPSLDADAIEALLARDDLPAPARRVIELRALTGSASVKKTLAMENECCRDDRLRNLMIHHGTRPGRPTGAGPQPLNLPKAGPKLVWCECGRPHKHAPLCSWCGGILRPDARKAWTPEMVDHVLEIMSLGSLDMVEQFFGDAMTTIQGCVRGLFVAAPGHDLVSTDYSSLQAVVAACIAGEEWRIRAFQKGEPIYLLGASKITGTPVEQYLAYFEQHGEHHPDRQKIGKVSELACGFQGWINSYRAFGSEETDEVIRQQILAWRAASPAIVETWGGQWRGPPWRRERPELYGFEGCFIAAIQNPGATYECRGILFCRENGEDCLTIRLYPDTTGWRRPLRYHQPRLTQSARNADEWSITYMTWNTNPNYGRRGWVPMPTWGGRLFENVVMGVEVDIQRDGEQRLLEHGYPLVLAVYDEDVSEIPHGKPLTLGLPPVPGLDPYVQEVEHLLGIPASFAYLPDGSPWPIKASGGWRGRRYRKG